MERSSRIDLNIAQRFCDVFSVGKLTFQTFDDVDGRKKPRLTDVIHGTFAESRDRLSDLNHCGAGIFLTINETDLQGRSAANVVSLRALFIDMDSKPLPAKWPLQPDVIVQRTQVRWHAYWLLAPKQPLARFSEAQKHLAKYYNSDPRISDLSRVMRIPGFLHQKDPNNPQKVELIRCIKPDFTWTIDEILEAHPIAEAPKEQAVHRISVPQNSDSNLRLFHAWVSKVAPDVVEGQRNNKLFNIAAEGAGRGIPKDETLQICMSIRNGLPEREVTELVKQAYSKERTANMPETEEVEHCRYFLSPSVTHNNGFSQDFPWSQHEPETVTDEVGFDELLDFKPDKDRSSLIGNRLLCEGGMMLINGSTGIGKSTLALQMAITWSMNKPFVGIKPREELRCLFIQAENDIGDLAEQAQGCIQGMKLDIDNSLRNHLREHVRIVRESSKTSIDFCKFLRVLIKRYNPHLIFGDPLLSYIGGDISKQETCAKFMRNGLTPVLQEEKVGLIWLHHTAKPSKDPKARSTWTAQDYSHIGIGSSDIPNCARAIAMLEQVDESSSTYRFVFTKRDKRAGMVNLDGSPTKVVYMRHAKDGLCWEQCEEPAPKVTYVNSNKKKKQESKFDQIISSLKEAPMKYSELTKLIQDVFDCSERTATGNRWKSLIELGMQKDADGNYFFLNLEGENK